MDNGQNACDCQWEQPLALYMYGGSYGRLVLFSALCSLWILEYSYNTVQQEFLLVQTFVYLKPTE